MTTSTISTASAGCDSDWWNNVPIWNRECHIDSRNPVGIFSLPCRFRFNHNQDVKYISIFDGKLTMRILYTSDIHAGKGHLASMLAVAEHEDAGAVIIGGDLIPHGLARVQELGILKAQEIYLNDTLIPSIREFRQRNETVFYLDMGNDDFIAGRPLLEAHDGELFHLLHMRKHQLSESMDIIGYMSVSPTPFAIKDWEKPDSRRRPYAKGGIVNLRGILSRTGEIKETVLDLDTDDTIEDDLSILSKDISRPFIFIAHCPPYDTPLDMLSNGFHVGSESIKAFIAQWSRRGYLPASFHGHIHESPAVSGSIRTTIEGSHCFNPGQSVGDLADLQYVLFEVTEGDRPEIKLLGPRAAR